MDIYWIQDHERKGPLPEVEVISMLEAGLIPENARAWHAGCPEWVCIRDLPALKGAGAVGREEGERRNREEEGLENAVFVRARSFRPGFQSRFPSWFL